MNPKRVTVELHGEYDWETHLLAGIWVSFQDSWRPPFLWRDIEALVQIFKVYGPNRLEVTRESLVLLEPGESIVCDDSFDFEALNALGSAWDWKLTRSTEGFVGKLPGTRLGGQADSATGGDPGGGEPSHDEEKD